MTLYHDVTYGRLTPSPLACFDTKGWRSKFFGLFRTSRASQAGRPRYTRRKLE